DLRETAQGLVVRIKGADFFVFSGSGEIRCSLRGRFRVMGAPEDVLPVVGDVVSFRKGGSGDTHGPRGLISGIEPRKSILARTDPSQKNGSRVLAANMDQAILVFAVKEPEPNARLLDRMLVAAGCGPMDAVICMNKLDLAPRREDVDEALLPYRSMGYRVICTSAKTLEGVGELAAAMAGKLSILVGPSGTGKTSLVSCVQPGLELAVTMVSARTGKGMHTTTHFELHRLTSGGYLGDTPGVREFGVRGVSRERLGGLFRDFVPFLGGCRFATCTHDHEPGCAVKDAVEGGLVSRERYESYLRILETVRDERSHASPAGRGARRRGAGPSRGKR
ncbi:MAG: ribosome small subunit-dependent GTPase A, partial [Candidatus Krumholzibacteriaceae bacterium]